MTWLILWCASGLALMAGVAVWCVLVDRRGIEWDDTLDRIRRGLD